MGGRGRCDVTPHPIRLTTMRTSIPVRSPNRSPDRGAGRVPGHVPGRGPGRGPGDRATTHRPALPAPRGPVSGHVVDLLSGRPVREVSGPTVQVRAIGDEDQALALYLLYELHYRGFADVDDAWEWNPALLDLRHRLERDLLVAVDDLVGPVADRPDVRADLLALFDDATGPSMAGWCATHGDHVHLREQAVHRSPYQLKEADPHTWALPRLEGGAKAALARIQFDEYGEGIERDMHAHLFALHLERMGLDARYGAYLDLVPGVTLATSNLVSLFGLHRRWRGALVGHLAVFEMASVPIMAQYSRALHGLGYDSWTRLFYDVHVTADAEHQTVALEELALGLVAQEPDLAHDVVYGARALTSLEALVTEHVVGSWEHGRTSLLGPLPVGPAPGRLERRAPGDDPRLVG